MPARYFAAIFVCFFTALSIEAATFTPVEINVPGLTNTLATGSNHFNSIVGYGSGSNGTVSFLRMFGSFSILSYPGATSTKAMGIDDSGDVVGTYTVGLGISHGFKYSGGSYTTIDAPSPALPGTTNLSGINSSGQIAGYASMTGGGIDSFVDSGGSFAFLPMNPGEQIVIYGLNDSGELVGVYVSADLSASFPIYGTVNGFTKVQGQPADAVLRAVNNNGHVILTTQGTSYLYSSATVTNDELITSIAFPGSRSTTAWGLSSLEAVVGQYIDSQGNSHAFEATTTRAPTCLVTGTEGPPRQLTFTIQDSDFGLKQISLYSSTNANVNIPSFTPGTTAPVLVTATPNDPSQNAAVHLAVYNTANVEQFSCLSSISAGPAAWSLMPGRLNSNITLVNFGSTLGDDIVLFGLGTDNALWYVGSNSNGALGSWVKIGSPAALLTGDPAVFPDSISGTEALVTDANGQLWQTAGSLGGSWQPWQSIASGVIGKAATVLDVAGIPHAFVRSSDGSVLSLVENSKSVWSQGPALGGAILSDPVALLDSNGNIEIYALGADNSFWNAEIMQDGTVIPWFSTGGSLKGNPTVISNAGTLYAFSRGTDDALWFSTQASGGSWTTWQSLGGILSNNPRAAVNSDGRVEVIVAGSDSSVWHISQISAGSAQWSNWSGLGGVIVGDVAPFDGLDGILKLFVLGSDRSVWQMDQSLPDNWQ